MRQHFQRIRRREERHQVDLEVGNLGLEEGDLEEDSPVLGEVRQVALEVDLEVDLEGDSHLDPMKKEC